MESAQQTQSSLVREPGNMLEELLDDARVERRDDEAVRIARHGVSAFMSELLKSGATYDRIDRGLVDQMIAEIDKRITAQVNEIMHTSEFQDLESTWRSIKYLIDHCDFRENVRVELLDVTKECLIEDFDDSPEIPKSGLYRTVYSSEYGTFGGHPFGAIVTEFDFDATHEDIRLLQQLASVAAMAHAPLLANASPRFFGEETFHPLPALRDLKALFESPHYGRWRAFRESEDARYVGLCMPRFLLRTPYGPEGKPVREFDFAEDVVDKHENYLWGPASFALAARAADSFAQYRWSPNIIGPRSGGAVEDLPLHTYTTMGELQTKLPVEVQLTERREFELSEEGFIGLVFRKSSDNAAFFSANSPQKPKVFPDTPEGKADELNYRLGTQLPYMFVITRLAHYIKVLQRENLGSWKTASMLQKELKRWLLQYTASGPMLQQETMSKRPFRAADIKVEDVPGEAGWYRCKIEVVPHFKYMGADFTLSLVGKLEKSAR